MEEEWIKKKRNKPQNIQPGSITTWEWRELMRGEVRGRTFIFGTHNAKWPLQLLCLKAEQEAENKQRFTVQFEEADDKLEIVSPKTPTKSKRVQIKNCLHLSVSHLSCSSAKTFVALSCSSPRTLPNTHFHQIKHNYPTIKVISGNINFSTLK